MTSVHAALVKAMASIGAVRKDGHNNHFKFNFRGIDHVVNAASPAFREHGITVHPHLHSIDRQQAGKMNAVFVVVDYIFTGPEGDSITTRVPGEAFDNGDKGTAKAMSVAFRTALLQTLALPTDDVDPDAESPQGVVGQAAPRQQPAPQQAAPMDPQKALKDVWDSEQGLNNLYKWSKQQGAPPAYLQQIENRVKELSEA